MRPALKTILEMHLKLMDEIDGSEELINSLSDFMETFEHDIGPQAVDLVDQLVRQY